MIDDYGCTLEACASLFPLRRGDGPTLLKLLKPILVVGGIFSIQLAEALVYNVGDFQDVDWVEVYVRIALGVYVA